ncbi:hypothetical protein WMY93_001433 [Mugilogobius chulae]|uniref:Uncharacterized protein n=1 Tax=Mugilogobius chulae TaxID=88201 RepID=A0AAW0Q583_9GOBI
MLLNERYHFVPEQRVGPDGRQWWQQQPNINIENAQYIIIGDNSQMAVDHRKEMRQEKRSGDSKIEGEEENSYKSEKKKTWTRRQFNLSNGRVRRAVFDAHELLRFAEIHIREWESSGILLLKTALCFQTVRSWSL